MEEWASFIGNVGFPVFMTVYLLVRLDKTIGKMMETLEELKQQIRK